MFRPVVLAFAVLLAACSAGATEVERGPVRFDPIVPNATVVPVADAESRELDRWLATCTRDPMDFLDNRDYCQRIGPWEGYRP